MTHRSNAKCPFDACPITWLCSNAGECGELIRRKNPHAKALGKLGGKVKSEAKAEASRKNGKLGGRPKKKP